MKKIAFTIIAVNVNMVCWGL